MFTAIKAGAIYFLVVYASGFALGTIRVLAIEPRIGRAAAVLLECPVILAISWVVCRRCVDVFKVQSRPTLRLLMGALAFVLLIGAEFALSVFAFGRDAGSFFSAYASLPDAIGLAAQGAFALFPALQAASAREPATL